MAQISKRNLFTFDVDAWGCKAGQRVTVGHNRAIELCDGILSGYLHGAEIVQFQDAGDMVKVCLDPCGYRTRTTQQAMRDFCKAMRLAVGVSFAKGGFSARWLAAPNDWQSLDVSDSGLITFHAIKGGR